MQSSCSIVNSKDVRDLESLELCGVLAVPIVAHVQARQNLRQREKKNTLSALCI